MKLYYLPNEGRENDPILAQVGPRKAFNRLVQDGTLSRLSTYSFLAKLRAGRSIEDIKREIISECEAFQPDIILWQHISEFQADDAFLVDLKRRSQCQLFVYHDEDPFGRFVKPITKQMAAMFRASDLVMMGGTGEFFELARRNGAKDVRYLAHSFDNVRFGKPWAPPMKRNVKLTMIGSRIRRRIPGLTFPGAPRRFELARKLDRLFGRSFALYGSGWDGLSSARGKIPFDQQEAALRQGLVSINWDHFDHIPYYFSDRLPISLAAGVPHVTSYHPGYEFLFKDCPGLFAVRTIDEAVSCAQWLLSQPTEELMKMGLEGKAWAEKHLEADVVYKDAIRICIDKICNKSSADI